MTQEFVLSEKIRKVKDFEVGLYAYPPEDVKEFIKRLKEIVGYGYHSEIDAIAGEKLIK
jgi:hypothetical protein